MDYLVNHFQADAHTHTQRTSFCSSIFKGRVCLYSQQTRHKPCSTWEPYPLGASKILLLRMNQSAIGRSVAWP